MNSCNHKLGIIIFLTPTKPKVANKKINKKTPDEIKKEISNIDNEWSLNNSLNKTED